VSNLKLIKRFHPAWDGDLLAASLIDQSLYRIHISDNHVEFAERIPVGRRIRYAHFHTDGRLVLWTDERELMFVSPSQASYTDDFVAHYMEQRSYDEKQRAQVRAALDTCVECHSFKVGVNTKAPSLAGVFDGKIGGTEFEHYSEALRSRSGTWSREELISFLKDPQGVIPGTTMPDPGIEDAFVLGELTELLKAIRTPGEPKDQAAKAP
jgi:cytochrome c2